MKKNEKSKLIAGGRPFQTPDFDVWHVQLQEIIVRRRPHGRVRIGVVNSGVHGKFNALGVETRNMTDTEARAVFTDESAAVQQRFTESMFDDHGHAVLGVFDTEDEAKRACERFCRSRKSVDACACEAIA